MACSFFPEVCLKDTYALQRRCLSEVFCSQLSLSNTNHVTRASSSGRLQDFATEQMVYYEKQIQSFLLLFNQTPLLNI